MKKDTGLVHLMYPSAPRRAKGKTTTPDDPEWEDVERYLDAIKPRIDRETIDRAKSVLILGDESTTEQEQVLKIIEWFTAHVYNNEPIEKAILEELARRLYDATIFQCPLNETLPLPWAPRSKPTTEEKNYSIFDDITQLIQEGLGVIDAINEAARRHFVSYEKAKKAYYDTLKKLESLEIEKSIKILEAMEACNKQ